MAFATDALRSLCMERAKMSRTWGDDSLDVELCLSVLAAATTLADVLTLEMCSIRPLKGDFVRASAFEVVCRAAQVQLRAVDRRARPMRVPAGEGLAAVRFVLLLAIGCNGQIAGSAVAS